jgi:hypothetical protein
LEQLIEKMKGEEGRPSVVVEPVRQGKIFELEDMEEEGFPRAKENYHPNSNVNANANARDDSLDKILEELKR